jgi:hypothetical protein
LAVFAFLWAAAAVVIELGMPQVIDPVYYKRWQFIRSERAADPEHTPTVVLFGSSRGYRAFHAVLLGEQLSRDLGRPVAVANLGLPGGGFINDLVTWRRLRRDGIRPDLVLIEAMPGLFWEDCPALLDEQALPSSRVTSFDLDVLERYRGDTRPDLGRQLALAEVSTLYSRRFALTYAVAPRLVPTCDANKRPFVWQENLPFDDFDLSPEDRAKALALARKEYFHYLTDFKPTRCEALRELLTACREAGSRAALVVLPEGPVFRGWYAPETWPQVRAWLDDISREFGVEVINAREWIEDENEFSDSHHLMPSGATRFSERLGREHILPMLRQ